MAEERRQGRDFPRETVLKFVLGEAVINSKGKSKQQQEAGERVRRQQARADSGRSDVAGAARKRTYRADDMSPEAVRSRLEGVHI